VTQIYWTSRAIADLDALYEFAARNSTDYADLLVQRIGQRISRLEDFPLAGRMVPEYERPDVREVIHAPYRIIYRIMFDEVHILVVQHGAKQLPDPLPM
jgi:toxin ParE1/3/4